MADLLKGQTAIITGGASGIGRALCIGLAAEGAGIAVVDNQAEGSVETAAMVIAAGGNATAYTVDVSEPAQIESMVRDVLADQGGIDILVNAAGIWPRHPFVDVTLEEWRRVIDINLTGTFLCCKAVAPTMIAQRSGKIVNLASGRGVAGGLNGTHYSASKGGIIAFTVALAMELGDYDINVNAVAPGGTETPLYRGGRPEGWSPPTNVTANRRIEEPDTVVGTVLFLVTDMSKTIFGETIFMKAP